MKTMYKTRADRPPLAQLSLKAKHKRAGRGSIAAPVAGRVSKQRSLDALILESRANSAATGMVGPTKGPGARLRKEKSVPYGGISRGATGARREKSVPGALYGNVYSKWIAIDGD